MRDDFYNTIGTTDRYVAATTAIPNIGSGAEEFFDVSGENSSNLFGLGKKAQAARKTKLEGKAAAKVGKADAKKMEAQAKIDAAKSAETTGIASANAAVEVAKAQVESDRLAALKGLSTPAKIGIVAGILFLLGVGAYFGLRKKK